MTKNCAVASGALISKNLVEQLNGIESSLTVDSNFVFDTIEDLVDFIKKDETKALDDFTSLVILDGAFNRLHTEKQNTFSFLLLQNLLNELGYTKLNLVLLTRNADLYETVNEIRTILSPVCYMNTDVLLAKKIGIKILSKVLLGNYQNTGLKYSR